MRNLKAQAREAVLPPMPPIEPRRPLDYEYPDPDGYMESDRDWSENNMDAVIWFLENYEAVRAAIHSDGRKVKR
jgi:hypothetical protein